MLKIINKNMIPNLILELSLNSKGILRKIFSFLRKITIYIWNDPEVRFHLNNRAIYLPLSHNLPFYLRDHTLYDQLLGRFSEYLHSKKGSVYGVDIGANVGDTILSMYRNKKDLFLAVEPEPKFLKYLEKNMLGYKNVLIDNTICSAEEMSGDFSFREHGGTASIERNSSYISNTKIDSLDNIIKKYPQISCVDIFKIDTDGHDFDVIRGSQNFVKQYKPSILFECDYFSNKNYLTELLSTLEFFLSNGYSKCLVYDNLGYLIGKYSLEDTDGFKKLLQYQLMKKSYYYDILVLPDMVFKGFYDEEKKFYGDFLKKEGKKSFFE